MYLLLAQCIAHAHRIYSSLSLTQCDITFCDQFRFFYIHLQYGARYARGCPIVTSEQSVNAIKIKRFSIYTEIKIISIAIILLAQHHSILQSGARL